MISLWMFPALFALIFLGFPVALSLISIAFVFGLITFSDAVFFQFITKIEGIASNFILAAVPLFVFMGSMLERSGIAQQLFSAIHIWTRRLPGGLAIGTILMCIIFAASTGVIGATETVVGLLAIPAMLKHKYSHSLISGTICAGGSLGTIIPPSVVVVVLGPIANVSIGDLMVGMIFPGLILAAVPLFVFMGSMLERSGIAQQLFSAIHIWTKRLPGGLAIGTVLMCIIFAASTGVIGATETVVGLLAIPAMLKHKYSHSLISGTICAGGSLGTIIPPSVVVVVLGPIADVSIGDLMVGMIFPGLILAGLYIVYILILCIIRPENGPTITEEDEIDRLTFNEKIIITTKALVPPLLMIFAVLGSIMLGFAAPTEAAALGAGGSLILTIFYKKFTIQTFKEALIKTITVTSMIMFILMAGSLFTGVFAASGGMSIMKNFVNSLDLTPWILLFSFLAIIFIAGFFLEWISILLIFIPIFAPIVTDIGFNPVWFCILVLIMIQTSYLTPPMAPAIFYLRGVSPPEMKLNTMYKGVIPFVGIQVVALAIVMIFPDLVTWLPEKLLGFENQ